AEVTQVSSLWLAHNEIATIEPGALAVLAQLKNLDISHNQIVEFPWRDLRNLSALQLLKMNNNRMALVPPDAFRTLKDLRSLRINNNRFATLAEGIFDSLSSLSHLQIYNNPFECSCSLQWLKRWMESTLISIPEKDSIACALPERLAHSHLCPRQDARMRPLLGVLALATLLSPGLACPTPCSCSTKKNGRLLAECAYRELRDVPRGLSPNVTILTLSVYRVAGQARSGAGARQFRLGILLLALGLLLW
ncbi:immunoglobulin superfamily containing leucine-rich repeat protein 2-like, partial [Geospiza fortis]|uniref:immunoglobulin superfamily containing leucine-rich repeat protein 2-like n=1 Tax=Geospiza fortis TaxID=48883 RepID=UPI0012437D54